MATVTSDQAAASFPVYRAMQRRAAYVEYGTYTIASALSKSDIIEFCKVDACLIIDGFLASPELDTDATPTMELDVGIAGDTDALLDSGVLTGEAVSDVLPTHATNKLTRLGFNGLYINGPLTVSSETTLIGTVTAVAATGGTGLVWISALCISNEAPV